MLKLKHLVKGVKMEKRDLYDSNRNLTGETIFKGE